MRNLLVALALLSVAGLAAAQTTAANLVQNPGFEQAGEGAVPANWMGSAAVYSRVTAPVHSGAAALQFANADPDSYQLCSQQLPLKVGKAYEYSVWVKTEGIQGDDTGASICMEWYGADGGYLGGGYPSGVKGTQDWTQVKSVSGRIPEGAVRCSVTCYVRQGMTGKAWFDDVSVTQWTEPPLQTMLLVPNYRGIIARGTRQVIISARVTLGDLDLVPADVVLQGRMTSSTSEVPVAMTEAAVTGERTRLAIPVPGLGAGQYQLTVSLALARGGRVLGTDSWRLQVVNEAALAGRAAYIDADNRLILGGKPFFPLGCYWSGIGEDELKTYADSAFNCLMPYGGPDKGQLDLAEKYGLKVIYSVKDAYFGSSFCPPEIRPEADEKPYIAEKTAAYRNHPALLAWYLNDELSQEFMDRLEAHQQWLEELDPGHPTWVVLYQVGEVDQYRKTFDVIGTDPYPIPASSTRRAAAYTKQTLEGVQGARPVWMVPQIMNWAVYQSNPARAAEMRPPTLPEMRSMAWQCLVHGAKGLIFYSYFDLLRDPQHPFAERWPEVKQMAAEIRPWTDLLLSGSPAVRVTTRDRAWLHWTTRASADGTFLFVVNDDDRPHQAFFRLSQKPHSVTVQGPTAEPVATQALSSLTVRLEPFAVRIYKLVF